MPSPKKTNTSPKLPDNLPVHEAALSPDLHDNDEDGAPDNISVFLTFVTFLGDVDKTAAALHMPAEDVKALAIVNGWFEKVDELNKLRTQEGGAAALAREINRTVNYVQTVRLRNMLDRAIRHVTRNEKRFRDFLRSHGKDASNISSRAPLELVKAVETVQRMSYAALGDTVSERLEGDGLNGTGGIRGKQQGAIHEVLNALSDARHQIEAEVTSVDGPDSGAKLEDE
jgi:hypothetical protein